MLEPHTEPYHDLLAELGGALQSLLASGHVKRVDTERISAYWVGNVLRIDVKGFIHAEH